MAVVIVKDDESALKLLEDLLKDPDGPVPEVEFKDWPRFEMHVEGERYHSTITPELMEAFLDLQKTINKAYALVRYTDSSRRLTNADRESLKILVEVRDGSSEFIAKLQEQLSTISNGLAEGFKTMDSRHKLIAFIALGGMSLGYLGYNDYLESQKEARKDDIAKVQLEAERDERLKTLELVSGNSKAEAERYRELFGMVVEKMPQVRTISEHMAGTYNKLIASAADADSVTVQGVTLPGAAVNELSKAPRNVGVDDRISGIYRIYSVDHKSDEDYKLTLFDVVRKVEIVALLPKDGSFVTDKMLDVLQEAEWRKRVVRLQLITKTRADKMVKAQIENVIRIEDQDAYKE